MEILVFKTNLRYKKSIRNAAPHLQTILGIHTWNVDLKDIDSILRIEAQNVTPSCIETTLRNAGFHCEELRD